MTRPTKNKSHMTFTQWFREYKRIAKHFYVGEKKSYRCFYDDGDTPLEAMYVEMSYAYYT